MFVRCGPSIINTDNIVQVKTMSEDPLRVNIVTTAVIFDEIGRDADTVVTSPYEIVLFGDDAERFLAALPVYEPVLGGDA